MSANHYHGAGIACAGVETGMECHSAAAPSTRLGLEQCAGIQNWVTTWMETRLQKKVHRCESKQSLQERKWKILLPRTQQ